ncbi:MAG TPA: hypothetical protein VJY99_13470 [Buttiauxella sp.]|uniref:hypothetical protein n=1 Tax=Buttiauxella sp. TaxID=1972222 RepID=UPI002B46FCCB|nr:hypothetical protein [Buttiauxella sp.]HKM97686.1 hypothetical protein [Buttiauxella sp.]
MNKFNLVVATLVGGLVLSPVAMALDLADGSWKGAGDPVSVVVSANAVTINGKKATQTINNPDFAEWKGAGYTLSFTRNGYETTGEWAKSHKHGALQQADSTSATSAKKLEKKDLMGLSTSAVEAKLKAAGWEEVYPYTEYTLKGQRVKIQYRADYSNSVVFQ